MRYCMYTVIMSVLGMVHPLYPVIVATSALENENKHQAIILHDWHQAQENPLTHQESQLQQFISALSKRKEKSTFFLEYPYFTKHFKKIDEHSIIHIPIKNALTHNMNYGSLEYKPFDKRTECFFWIREMIHNFDSVETVLNSHEALPEEFHAVSIQAWQDMVNYEEEESQRIFNLLPSSTQPSFINKLAMFKDLREYISQKRTTLDIARKEHFFNLIRKIKKDDSSKIAEFYIKFVATHAVYSDISLVHDIIADHNPLSIVHAGIYHSDFVEKTLKKTGFTDSLPLENLKEDLNAEDLENIQLPKSIPSCFSHPLYRLLHLCCSCGTETTHRCSQCKKTYYCSSACQKKEWPEHKKNCHQ